MATALIIDDNPKSLLELGELAGDCGFRVDSARDIESASSYLLRRAPDVALINVHIGAGDGTEDAFRLFAREELDGVTEVYLVGREADYRTALQGMQLGASDHFLWPDEADRLRENLTGFREDLDARKDARADGKDHHLLHGKSPAMNRIYRLVRKVSPTHATVLLIGESGTGKELVARSIHEQSDRAKGPFVAMNCGAIAAELVESEMFGHRKGAFTGANSSHKGYFERAANGTLFLDEITEMSLDLQVKLLRVLETRYIRRVGGETDIPVNVRIIASTNREPQEALADDVLREDLYYRLAEFPLRVPPLRERGGDVVLLARKFLDEANAREKTTVTFSDEALDLLRLHDWPGNVRELKNAVSRAFILADGRILPNDLPGNIPAGNTLSGDYLRFPVGFPLKELERRMILATLEHCEDDKPRAAAALGISLKTLYNRLKRYRRG